MMAAPANPSPTNQTPPSPDTSSKPNPYLTEMQEKPSPKSPTTPSSDTSLKPNPYLPKDGLQQRLQTLKMKINQSKRLNRKQVMEEAERSGAEGKKNYENRLRAAQKERQKQEWSDCHDKVPGAIKEMTMSASDSTRKHAKRTAKLVSNRFDVDDFYNSEGQHRNYERNLRSVRVLADRQEGAYDPLEVEKKVGEDGVKRLSRELKRRGEKSMGKKVQKLDFEGVDVSYVNQRNKRFNEKINRNYDKFTAEIKQNLERGTAL